MGPNPSTAFLAPAKKRAFAATSLAILLSASNVATAKLVVNDAGDPNPNTALKCTLRAAVDSVNEEEINGGCTAYQKGTDKLIEFEDGISLIEIDGSINGPIKISKPMTIEGAGDVTLSGQNKYQIFSVTLPEGGTVNLWGLKFTKGFVDGGGGAIRGNGNTGNLVIANSWFIVNKAGNKEGAPTGFGGAVSSSMPTEIISSEFLNNTAQLRGGAVEGSQLTIKHSHFTQNKAIYGGGGGVDCDASSGGYLDMSDTIVTNNKAGALNENGSPKYGGGGISSNCPTKIQLSEISFNSVAGEIGGGGIYFKAGAAGFDKPAEIVHSKIRGNEVKHVLELIAVGGQPVVSIGVKGVGGGLATDANLLISKSEISNNISLGDEGGGGTHFTALSKSVVSNTVFIANSSRNGDRKHGGAISALNAEVDVIHSTAYQSDAEDEMYAVDLGTINLTNSIVYGKEGTCTEAIVNYSGQIFDFGGNMQYTTEVPMKGECGEPVDPQQPSLGYTVPDVDPSLVPGIFDAPLSIMPDGGPLNLFYYMTTAKESIVSDPFLVADCHLPPVNGVDMRDVPRHGLFCHSGAVEPWLIIPGGAD